MAGAHLSTPPAGQDKLRLVLDYMPCEVCLAIPSAEDQDTLCSICARLNRTIVERVVVQGGMTPAEEREAARAAPPAAMAEGSEPEVEVVLSELAPRAEPAAPLDASVWESPEEPRDAGAVEGLSAFTLVAPARGTVEGDWVVPGDELGSGGVGAFSEDLAADLALSDSPAEPALWPGEEPSGGEPTSGVLGENPEGAGDGPKWEEPDDSFWEGVLEGAESPAGRVESEVETFEPAEDWLSEKGPGAPAPAEDVWQALPADASDALTFELDEGAPPKDDLEFEEVEFSVAPPPAEEPETVEAEAMAEIEWPGDERDMVDTDTADLVEEERLGPEDRPAGGAYAHGPYTLYHKVVETGDGETRDLYFFARAPPEDASPSSLPDGYEVGVNERTGVPFVRRVV